MAQVNRIRELFFEKGLKYAEISRVTGFDVKTVKKYIYQEDFNPMPKVQKPRPSKLEPYKKDIDAWLEEDKQYRKKQRHTARRIFARLAEKYPAFDCSYRLVASYVAEKKLELYGESRFYMPLRHIPGEAQVDFGAAEFYERGTRHKGHYLNISFPHSNGGYLQLFKGENRECLMEGLINFFSHVGGVPHRIWFDNPATIVTKIFEDGERVLNETFARFKNHYGFTAAFCNVGKGNEKGNVENKVGYFRRNLLVPVPRFDDLKAFNRQLLEQCDRDMHRPHYKKETFIADLFEEDRARFLPLPAAEFDAAGLVTVRTDSYAKFTLEEGKHTYSTAPRYARSSLLVKLTAYDVIVLDENHREVVRHPRLYGEKRQESMDWLPYLNQLARRPAALKYTGIYDLLPSTVRSFLDECNARGKGETLRVLAELSRETDFIQATGALETALRYGVGDTDSILAIFNRINSKVVELDPLVLPPSTPRMPSVHPQVDQYDRLFLKGGTGLEAKDRRVL